MGFLEIIYILFTLLTIGLLILTLKIQFKLKSMYHNGYQNHRKAFILTTFFLLLLTVSRFAVIGFDLDFDLIRKLSYWQLTNFWIITSSLFCISILKYLWFKGSNFKFLSGIKNSITGQG